MNRTVIAFLAATALSAGAASMANAQGYTERADQLSARIDMGIRNGQLTQNEAERLRSQLRDVVRLQERYSRDGMTASERADLDRRFDTLSTQVYAERNDQDRYARGDANRYDRGPGDRYAQNDRDRNGAPRWENLDQRQAMFNQRLQRAVSDGRLTRRQAADLRIQFDRIARLERQYRRDGMTSTERADLDTRMDQLQTRFRSEVNANQYGYGYGQAPNLFDYLFGIR